MALAYIGMGSNLASPAGPPETTLAAAADRLQSLGQVKARSSLYSTEPVGYAPQPRFLNTVVALDTSLSAPALLESLMRIEQEFGRDRKSSIPNGPRTLDLDILILGDLATHEPGLEIPHPRMAEREFVMIPLAEIASKLGEFDQPRMVHNLLKTFHERPPGKPHAVVRLEGATWRARVSWNGGPSAGSQS
jgi:2-amino-4-hydroxy-6-hydroxymethyldihydropteridine diphosphokinase